MSLPDIASSLDSIVVATNFTTDHVPVGLKMYGQPTMRGAVVFEHTAPIDNQPGRIRVHGDCHFTGIAERNLPQKHNTATREVLARTLCFAVYRRAECGKCLECNTCEQLTGIEKDIKANARGSRYRLSGARIWKAIATKPGFDPARARCLRLPETTSSFG